MLKLMNLQNVECITKRKTGIVLLLLLICFCIVYNVSLIPLYDNSVASNVSLMPLYDNNMASNVSLLPLYDNNVASNVSLISLYDNNVASNVSLIPLYDNNVTSNVSLIPLYDNNVASNVSLVPLHDNNVVSNVSLVTLHDNNVVFNSSSVLRSELLILWYNKPIWINELLVHKTLGTCPYNNCFSTTNKALFNQSAGVIYLISSDGMPTVPPVAAAHRNKDQAWIFFNLEPQTIYGINFGPEWTTVMNWSMMYHRDADIFYPYGTLEPRDNSQSVLDKKNYTAIFDGKTVFASWFVSHCNVQSRRDEYVKQMKKYGVKIDIFGSCNSNQPSLPKADPKKIDMVLYQSKFYLSFENSFCEDYVTEKFFERYNSDTILVVRGGSNYTKNFPPGTFVNAADFGTAKKLAEYLIRLGNNKDEYIAMMRRKDMYVSTQPQLEDCKCYCKLCEMLNNVDKYRKTYKSIREYVDSKPCAAPKDIE